MGFLFWVGVFLLLVLLLWLLEREVYFYEGVHLGPRVQAWLYDRWAAKYDSDKRASQLEDNRMLAQPLLDSIRDLPEPFLLDFATGTGRLSFALLSRPEFKGRILALDLSQGMLERAAAKLSAHSSRVEFLRHLALPLPFPDASFDIVCALEVLELFPEMEYPVSELTRVLRPGGTLLTSRGTEASGRKARVKSRAQMVGLLEQQGYLQMEISPWWKFFDRILAVKDGDSKPIGPRGLVDVYQCPACKQTEWTRCPSSLTCGHCGKSLPVTEQGIILG